VQELKELQRQGMSIQAFSKLTGWDRKTIRKYPQQPSALPEYGPRQAQASKLDPFKPYLEERMRAGVWNACVLLRELRERELLRWVHDSERLATTAAKGHANRGGTTIRDPTW
jgi:transposase